MNFLFYCILGLIIIFAASCVVAMVEVIADIIDRRAKRKDKWDRRLP